MTIKPLPMPQIRNEADDLFGFSDVLSPKKPVDLAADLFALPKLPEVTTSASAQQAIRNMEASMQMAEQGAKNAQSYIAQKQKEIDALNKQTAQAMEQANKIAQERKKLEEERKKEAAKKVEEDKTALVQDDISAVLNSETYKKAGDLQRKAILETQKAKVEAKLRGMGLDDATVAKSLNGFSSAVESDIKRYINENDDREVFSDIGRSVVKSIKSWFKSDEEDESGQIASAQSKLSSGAKGVSGWDTEEILERDPSVAKYLKKTSNMGFDSLSSWELRSDLSKAERAEFDKKVSAVFQSSLDKIDQYAKEEQAWQDKFSGTHQRHQKNLAYERELMAAERAKNGGGWWEELSDGMTILSKYGATAATDQAGNLAAIIGTSLATAAATAAIPVSGGTSTAAAATGVARIGIGLAKLGRYLVGAGSGAFVGAELTEHDIISSTRESILNTSTEQLAKANPELWADALKLSNGNAELAKQRIASMQADDEVTKAYLVSLGLNLLGPETLAARALAKVGSKAVGASIGKEVALGAVGAVSEAVEEGYTQYATNLGIANATLDEKKRSEADLFNGVFEAAGMGLAMGAMISTPSSALSVINSMRDNSVSEARDTVASTFSEDNITAKKSQYQEMGNVDIGRVKQTVLQDLLDLETKQNKVYKDAPEMGSVGLQRYFDLIIDDGVNLTDKQRKDLFEAIKANYPSINTNRYRTAVHTPSFGAIDNADVAPTDKDLLDVWRAVHNKDTDKISNVATATALADVYAKLNNKHGEETTRSRANRYFALKSEIKQRYPNLTNDDIAYMDIFVGKHFDANFSRVTDNEQSRQSNPRTSSTNTSRTVPTDTQESTQAENTLFGTTETEQGTNDAQGVGGGDTRETFTSMGEGTTTTASSAGTDGAVQGVREVSPTQSQENATPTLRFTSEQTSQDGLDGRAEQGARPTNLVTNPTTQATTSDRESGVTQTERSADGERTSSITEKELDLYKSAITKLSNKDYGVLVDFTRRLKTLNGDGTTLSADDVVYAVVNIERTEPSERASRISWVLLDTGYTPADVQTRTKALLDVFTKVMANYGNYDSNEQQPLPSDEPSAMVDATVENPNNTRLTEAVYTDLDENGRVVRRTETQYVPNERIRTADGRTLAEVRQAQQPKEQEPQPLETAQLSEHLSDSTLNNTLDTVVGADVTLRGVDGTVVQRGSEYVFVAYDSDTQRVLGNTGTPRTLSDVGITAVRNRKPSPNERMQRSINMAGREQSAIWAAIYDAINQPSTDTVMTQEQLDLLEQAVKEPHNTDELADAIDLLALQFNGDRDKAMDFLEQQLDHAEAMYGYVDNNDYDGAINHILGVASELEYKQLMDDYSAAIDLAYQTAEVNGEVDLLQSAILEQIDSQISIHDRIGVLLAYADNKAVEQTPVVEQLRTNYTLTTDSADISKAIADLTADPSTRKVKHLSAKSKTIADRQKALKQKIVSKSFSGKMSDRVSQYIDAHDMAVKLTIGSKAKIGALVKQGNSIVFLADDGTGTPIEMPTPHSSTTFNTWNAANAAYKLEPALPLYLTNDFISHKVANYATQTVKTPNRSRFSEITSAQRETETNPQASDSRTSQSETVKGGDNAETTSNTPTRTRVSENQGTDQVGGMGTHNDPQRTVRGQSQTNDVKEQETALNEVELDLLNSIVDGYNDGKFADMHTSLDEIKAQLTADVEHGVTETINAYAKFAKDESGKKLSLAKAKKLLTEIGKKLLNSVRNTVATVALAIAAYTGVSVSVPVEAQASANYTQEQVVEHITQSNDNDGKSFIVANKRSGSITVYNAKGEVAATAPALYGKAVNDQVGTVNTTPAGRYELRQDTPADSKYGGNVQSLVGATYKVKGEPNTSYQVAIHRVINQKGQNRKGRLQSKTASDNRISLGCINVPEQFYNTHLDGNFDGVIYVLPETENFNGTLFKDGNAPSVQSLVSKSEPSTNEVGTSTSTQKEPKTISVEQLRNGKDVNELTQAPTVSETPVAIDGTTPSEQVANIEPVITENDVSITKVAVPQGELTPAEQEPTVKFDTEPTTETSSDGVSLAEIAIALVGIGAGGYGVKRLRSRKKQDKEPTADKPKGDSLDTDGVTENLKETPLASAIKDILNERAKQDEAMMANTLEYLINTDGEAVTEFLNNFEFYRANFDLAMSDNTMQTATRKWDDYMTWRNPNEKSEMKRKWGLGALGQYLAHHAAGITPKFDDFLNNLKDENGQSAVPRYGKAQDSNVVSVAHAQIRAKETAIYGDMHHMYMQGVDTQMSAMNLKYAHLSKGKKEGEFGANPAYDMGTYHKIRHILGEGATEFFNNKLEYIVALEGMTGKIADNIVSAFGTLVDGHVLMNALYKDNDTALDKFIANAPNGKKTEIRKNLTSFKKFRQQIERERASFNKHLAVYEGREAWTSKVKLLDGATKKELQDEMAQLEAIYDKKDLEQSADMLRDAFMNIRKFGVSFGAYDTADVQAWNKIGFKDYAPLYTSRQDDEVDTSDDTVQNTAYDDFFTDVIEHDYLTMNLAKDMTRFHRNGASKGVRADNSYLNLAVFARNMSSRSADADFRKKLQGLFEDTLYGGEPDLDSITNYEDNKLVQQGKIKGIVRVRADVPKTFLPKQFKDIQPITAKGTHVNPDGETEEITYHYYFTDKAIQQELTRKLSKKNIADKSFFLSNTRTIMRYHAQLMTTKTPLWNIWNFTKEMIERGVIITMRPVNDSKGNRINRLKLFTEYSKVLGGLTASPSAMKEVMAYLQKREVKTPLQRTLRDMHQSGAINLYTDTTEKYDLMGKNERSAIENLVKQINEQTKKLSSKTKATQKIYNAADKATVTYMLAVAELPQVMNALAMGQAYRNLDVNTAEANNRVRDAFDPLRTQSGAVHFLMSFFPFVRSTGAGHYNTWRTIGDLFREPSGIFAFTVMVAIALGVVMLAAQAMGEDEDGNALLAMMDMDDLKRGIPIRTGEDEVFYFPVGHGGPTLIYTAAVGIYKLMNDPKYTTADYAGDMAGQVVKNVALTQMPSGKSMLENPFASIALAVTPTVLLPFMENAFNLKLFGGGHVVYSPTGKGEHDYEQDTFHTPEAYKSMAETLYKASFGAIDMRPEELRNVLNGTLFVGPLRGIEAMLQDKGDKTAGVFMNKGEYVGPIGIALGAGSGVDHKALSAERMMYRLVEGKYEILEKYDISDTKDSTEEQPDNVEVDGVDDALVKKGSKAERLKVLLHEAGASTDEIQFVVNTTLFENEKKKLNKTLRDNSKMEVSQSELEQNAYDLLVLYEQYVKDNNGLYRSIE